MRWLKASEVKKEGCYALKTKESPALQIAEVYWNGEFFAGLAVKTTGISVPLSNYRSYDGWDFFFGPFPKPPEIEE